MKICTHHFAILRGILAVVLVLFPFAQIPATNGQTQNKPQDQDEVISVTTELVQTGLTVLDKQGHFVEGLTREQFELRVDGKPQPISFFEVVTAGSASEKALIEAARGTPRSVTDKDQAPRSSLNGGRTFFFFVDDLHMKADSLIRTRKTILQFLQREMEPDDQAAVTSASGQVGFLQQLTDNKTVLRAAAARLKPLPQLTGDGQDPPMSEYLALAIEEKHDREVLGVFMSPLIRDGMSRSAAESIVRVRASQIIRQSSAYHKNTLASLNSFVRNVAPLSGRKVVFFLSDGFPLQLREPGITDRLRSITDAAARNGVVIYTADSRGLSTDVSFDASNRGIFDITGAITRAQAGELTSTQNSLRTIAEETGGRALLNTNAIDAAISKTVKETSTYYLLAWQPTSDELKGKKFRKVEVSVMGRTGLTVLVQRGFLQTPRGGGDQLAKKGGSAAAAKPAQVKTPDEELRTAIGAIYPVGGLPTYLTVNYVDTPKNGVVLSALMSTPFDALTFTSLDGKNAGALDIEGQIYNDQGKAGSRFKDRLNVTPASSEAQASQPRRSVLFNHQISLAPGLYQVRVAARDVNSGRVGSAVRWVEIPDLKSGRLTLGSLQIGERPLAQTGEAADQQNFVAQFSADRRFTPDSHLRFLTHIYNAATGASPPQQQQGASPDLVLQIQVFRNDQPVISDELRKVPTAGQDFARMAYGAEIPLKALAAGRYVLQVTVIDRIAKTSASQRAAFTVE